MVTRSRRGSSFADSVPHVNLTPNAFLSDKIGQKTVRRSIEDSFSQFRGEDLDQEKLSEYENRVCLDEYMLRPRVAAKRILALMEEFQGCETPGGSPVLESQGRSTAATRFFDGSF